MTNLKNVLANAFSLQMLPAGYSDMLSIESITSADIPADCESAVGHPDTARVLSAILGREIPCQRINVVLNENTALYVAQYSGGRLPEGATELPEGATFNYFRITIPVRGIAEMDMGGVTYYPR